MISPNDKIEAQVEFRFNIDRVRASVVEFLEARNTDLKTMVEAELSKLEFEGFIQKTFEDALRRAVRGELEDRIKDRARDMAEEAIKATGLKYSWEE